MVDSHSVSNTLSEEWERLQGQNQQLQAELEDARETLRAIREGEVDALVVNTSRGEQVFTLTGADYAYRTLVEQMHEGAVTVALDGSIGYSNRRFADLVQFPLERIVGSPFRDYIVPGDRPRLEHLLQTARDVGSARGEMELQTAAGPSRPVHLGLSRVGTDDRWSLCIVVTDLTEQKQAERILASERHARAILNQALDAIVVCDAQARLTFVNAAARKLAGLDPTSTELDLGDDAWGEYFSLDGPPLPVQAQPMQRALRGELIRQKEYRIVRSDGSHGVFLVNASPLRDRDGRILGAVGTFDDITERKQAVQALARGARRQELLTRAATRAIAQTDLQALLDTLAEAVVELCEARVGVAGHGSREDEFLVGAAFPPTSEHALGDVFRVERGGVYLELIQYGESLRLSDAQLRSHPRWWGLPAGHLPLRGLLGARLVDAQGQPNGLLLVSDKTDGGEFTAEDETLLKQMAAIASLALQHIEARRAAEAANQAKSHFLANMSHELRTPMTAVLGMTDLAITEATTATMRDHLETVQESASFLLELLDQILDFARIEAGHCELELAPFRLRRSLDQIIKGLRVRAREKGLTMRCLVAAEVPDVVTGDALRLRQILTNLLGNAVKFTSRGEVALEVSLVSPETLPRRHAAEKPEEATSVAVRFQVSDTGIGISAEQREKIFAPFSQADASISRHYGGSGLGLAIASNLVSLMGGELRVESQLGQGSRFNFTIPMAYGAQEASLLWHQEAAGPRLSQFPTRRLKVLLAEDTPANQKLIQHVLGNRGHHLVVVSNGQDAVARMEKEDFDAVLMDVQMPLMDGFQATAAIRGLGEPKAHVPIIALTAHALRGDAERCLAAGMNAYLSKPISAEQLIALVEEHGNVADSAATANTALNEASTADSIPVSFNLLQAVQTCFGKYPLFQEMAICFLQESPLLLAKLREAVATGETSEAARLAHRFKNTVCYLGANSTLDAVKQLEAATQSGQLPAAEKALHQLSEEVLALSAVLQPYLDADDD